MQAEYDSIMKNDTWELVDQPEQRKVIGTKWVWKTKYKADGSMEKYKVHLVAQGFSQVEGFDFQETFAPTARMTTIRVVLALAAHKKWPVFQMDVKSAFLNGYLKEEVYVAQPPGFEVSGQEYKVCRLKLQVEEGIVWAETCPEGMVPKDRWFLSLHQLQKEHF